MRFTGWRLFDGIVQPHLCEDFAVVDANNGSSHLGHNNLKKMLLKTENRKQRGVPRRGPDGENGEVAFDVVETHHVPEVGLDHVGLLVGGSLLLLLPQLLDEGHGLPVTFCLMTTASKCINIVISK